MSSFKCTEFEGLNTSNNTASDIEIPQKQQ